MRKSTTYLLTLATLAALAAACTLHAAWLQGSAAPLRQRNRAVVQRYQLTDLNLFNEARYTRHLSQADRHSPFQDHPTALEHFPSGALTPPPVPAGSQP